MPGTLTVVAAFAVLLAATALVFELRRRRNRISSKSASYKRALGLREEPTPAPPPQAAKAPPPVVLAKPLAAPAPEISAEPAPVVAQQGNPEGATAKPQRREKAAKPGKLSGIKKALARKTTLPKTYERGLVMLYKPPGSVEKSALPEFLLPWVIAQSRETTVAPSFSALNTAEIRLVELSYEAMTTGDRAFGEVRKDATETERDFLDYIRPMAKREARATLQQIRDRDGLQSRLDKVLSQGIVG